ncbi:MAG: hypothetical protein QOG87_1090, partial [Actinomycetota bacterium]
MRLACFQQGDGIHVGVVEGDEVVDLGPGESVLDGIGRKADGPRL